jgi:HAD superfamily hydrolase (TIGR01549 family)
MVTGRQCRRSEPSLIQDNFKNTLHTNATPPSWQAVFFDFDGVIADSTEVKVRAFATLFAPYGPEVQKAVIRYHLDNGGMPRHQKIRHCFETFAGLTLTDSELSRAGQTFSDLVLDAVVAAPFIGGALSTLQRLQQASIPAFVVSGTPEDEMRLIVERKGLSSSFLEVHGSPRAKPAIVADILARHKYRPNQCLFIGDALADYRAAQGAGLRFLGIVPADLDSIFPEDVAISSEVTLPL